VKYTFYDFHTETKGDNFHRLNDLMVKIEGLQDNFKFFLENRKSEKIVNR